MNAYFNLRKKIHLYIIEYKFWGKLRRKLLKRKFPKSLLHFQQNNNINYLREFRNISRSK